MTQLYYLKNGGIGHYDDVWKENFVEAHESMSFSDLKELASNLLKINPGKNGLWCTSLLTEALELLNENTPKSCRKALELIADSAYTYRRLIHANTHR